MNPKPLVSLNHLTFPVAIARHSFPVTKTAPRRESSWVARGAGPTRPNDVHHSGIHIPMILKDSQNVPQTRSRLCRDYPTCHPIGKILSKFQSGCVKEVAREARVIHI